MKVQVTGYISNQLQPVYFLKLLREVTGDSLESAKDRLALLTAGHIIELQFQTRESAEIFLRASANIGVKAHISAR
jgi:hypothetical protein